MGGKRENIYEVDILPTSGNYSVYRFQNNKLLKLVPLRKHNSINAGTKVTNKLSVVVKGSKGSITINGKKVGEFTGKPPEGGSLVGVNFGTYDDYAGPFDHHRDRLPGAQGCGRRRDGRRSELATDYDFLLRGGLISAVNNHAKR